MKKHRIKYMVEQTLKENPSWRGIYATDNDMVLTILIWQRYYNVGTNEDSTIHLYKLLDLPTQDSVKRWRAKFQNEYKQYLPTKWVIAKKRGIARDDWEESLGYRLKPQEVEQHHVNLQQTKVPVFQNTLLEVEPTKRYFI